MLDESAGAMSHVLDPEMFGQYNLTVGYHQEADIRMGCVLLLLPPAAKPRALLPHTQTTSITSPQPNHTRCARARTQTHCIAPQPTPYAHDCASARPCVLLPNSKPGITLPQPNHMDPHSSSASTALSKHDDPVSTSFFGTAIFVVQKVSHTR